jgi:alkylation response protein AidB-like acyl-CoA dehydrogenase
MDSETTPVTIVPGGSFLHRDTAMGTVLPPSRDSLLIADTMTQFVRQEVLPQVTALEVREEGAMRRLMQKAGELGLLAGAIPQAYGGLELSRTENALLSERAALYPSFALTQNVHSGVATLPLVWFGTDEQKARYLPAIAQGEKIAAFALTEANAGSDALSARCQAVPNDSGFTLTGAKSWITNAGLADLFTVFARISEVGLTAFLVERNSPGLTLGKEEEKLGLRGTSTRAVFLDDVRVPASAVLGDPGQGHRVALYPLNIGRLHIAAGALGACKANLYSAVRYAKERRQFGKSLAEFGLIQGKLGEMAARVFAAESMVYRTCDLLDRAIAQGYAPYVAAEEYAVECALAKIYATEALDFVVDECLQIHGGYGYSEAFPIARAYRDARVMRIFEGTNEINRLTVTDQLGRRFRTGRLPLRYKEEPSYLDGLRTAVRTVLLALWERIPPEETEQHQEAFACCADMVLSLFAADSAVLWELNQPDAVDAWQVDAWQRFATDCGWAVFGDAVRQVRHRAAELADYPVDMSLRHRVYEVLPEGYFDAITRRRELAASLLEGVGWSWLTTIEGN